MSTQTPREIAFEDIKKGDEIRAEYAEGGIKFTREGVAHKNAYGGWFTREDGLIVTDDGEATITLLHRPVPAEPEGLGAVVRARPLGRLTDATDRFVRFAESGDKTSWIRAGEGGGFRWSDFDPESIEVLSEGIEVES